MRYTGIENPIVAAVLPAGGTCTVEVLRQDTNALLLLTSVFAAESAVPGLWQFNLANIVTDIDGFAQLIIVFTHSGGEKDYAKVVVRGYVDEISKIRKLVSATL